MKKIILTILLVAIATATHCCGTVGAPCQSGVGDCSACPDPSFDVNSQVCVDQPCTVRPPECVVPDVECP